MGGVGSGAKPKTYPADLVTTVERLYQDGHSQHEIAAMVGTTQKVVWRLMIRHGLDKRRPIKRFQTGCLNDSWKGDSASYAALHLRVQTARGTPSLCEHCNATQGKFEWANLSGAYHDVNDYVRLCKSCHSKMDEMHKNFPQKKGGPHNVRKD